MSNFDVAVEELIAKGLSLLPLVRQIGTKLSINCEGYKSDWIHKSFYFFLLIDMVSSYHRFYSFFF